MRGTTGGLYRCETDRHHTGWKWRGEKRRAAFLGGCCQCLCLCSFQTSLEMKDVSLLTTPPSPHLPHPSPSRPPPNSLHPLLLYLLLPSPLPDFSFTTLIHFSQLFQALFKVIIVWAGGSHFVWRSFPTFPSVTLQRCTGRIPHQGRTRPAAHTFIKSRRFVVVCTANRRVKALQARAPRGIHTSRQFCSSFIHLATLLSQRAEQILNKDQ